MLISVIVPVYNSERYLGRCIESILSQTYKEFELILVDDGSRDSSADICQEFVSHDERVKLLQQQNGGVTSARHRGWSESKGDWIVFVDSDDTVSKDCLSILLTAALTTQSDIVNACFRSTSDNRVWTHKRMGEMKRSEYLEAFAKNEIYGTLYASIYKRLLFQKSTFQFDSSIKIGEDVLCCIELGLRILKASNIPDVVYNYYDNQDSVMNQKVVHPSYLERYFALSDDLFSKSGGLRNEVLLERQKDHNKKLLSAFFSPFISFDDVYCMHLKEYIASQDSSALDACKGIYRMSINSLPLAKVVKRVNNFLFAVKTSLKGEKVYSKEVIR